MPAFAPVFVHCLESGNYCTSQQQRLDLVKTRTISDELSTRLFAFNSFIVRHRGGCPFLVLDGGRVGGWRDRGETIGEKWLKCTKTAVSKHRLR